jgi:phage repressor protein C with HTH and peptisase S24 domain
MMDRYADRLNWAMKNAGGITQSDLARRVGVKQASVWHLLQPEAQKSGLTPQIARALGVNPDWLATGIGPRLALESAQPTVPVVGYVGAGAEVFFVDDLAKGQRIDDAPPFPGQDGHVNAVRVRGDSMLPQLENGWTLYYSVDQSAGVMEDAINRLSVVQVHEGPVLVKKLERGRKKNLWRLVSHNASPRDDVRLDWAARVRAIVP